MAARRSCSPDDGRCVVKTDITMDIHVGDQWEDDVTRDKVRAAAEDISKTLIDLIRFVEEARGRDEVPTQIMSLMVSLLVSFGCMFGIDPDAAAEQLFVSVPNGMREHYERMRTLSRGDRR